MLSRLHRCYLLDSDRQDVGNVEKQVEKNYPSYDTVWGLENSDDTLIWLIRSRITRGQTKMAALTFDLRRAERTNGEAVCKKGKQAVLGASLGRCVSIMRSLFPWLLRKEQKYSHHFHQQSRVPKHIHSLVLFV